MNLREGTLLKHGEYRIERELGHGGFGVTYLATQIGLNRRVAIKEFFMREYCNRDADTSQVSVGSEGSKELVEKFRKKFIKEAQNIACLKHPHIISIHDVFEDNGTAYYVMEYLDHGSLADLVKQRGRLPEADALRYIRQIADALRYIHARKMNHLDVKPGNILIDETDHAVLIDFGLSKRYDDEGNQTSTTPVGISHGYAPLEQYKKSGVGTFSPATDIYSLGATLYMLVTGNTPPDADTVMDEGLPALPPYVSSYIAKAIEQAMQPGRKKRPQSVDAFQALLDVKPSKFPKKLLPKKQHPAKVDEVTVIDINDNVDVNDNKDKHEDLNHPEGGSTSTLSSTLKKYLLPAVACVVVLVVVLSVSMRENFLSAEKQYELAQNYYNGHGVTQDYVKAVEWYRKAAEQGFADAQYMLGLCYYNGQGVTQDYVQSFDWFHKAAKQELAVAQNHVGFCYKTGLGVVPDTVKAVDWYRKAANQGQVNAQCNLGNSHYFGHGVTQDYVKATEWYHKAADQGFVDAQYMLGICYYHGQGVPQDYTQAAEWLGKAQAQGDADAGEWLAKAEVRKSYTVNGVSFTMVRVAGGTFTMGASASDSDADSDDNPAHQVTLSSYSIGETEVTQALWQAVMGNNPSNFKGNSQRPVEYVSWNDCQEFIRKLNALTGATFRLPTEAEWEYAARGGSQSRGYKYSGSDNLGSVAWCKDNSSSTTHSVKTKQPNELGLYDMSGNVWEWCADWYSDSYYASSSKNNPTGPSSGSRRVLRGGCCSNDEKICRVANRFAPPVSRFESYGFRLAQ